MEVKRERETRIVQSIQNFGKPQFYKGHSICMYFILSRVLRLDLFLPHQVLRRCFHGVISDNPKVLLLSSNSQLTAHHFMYEIMAASSVCSSVYNHIYLMSLEFFKAYCAITPGET